MASTSLVRSCSDLLRPDGARTVFRPFHIVDPASSPAGMERLRRIVERVRGLPAEQTQTELGEALEALGPRHGDVTPLLDKRFGEIAACYEGGLDLDEAQERLIGAVFSEEFSIEAAALFNPSVVPHFDQSGLGEGETRILLSLRGIGEGHISSLIFQTGIWHADGSATLDARGPRAIGPSLVMPDDAAGQRTAELQFSADVPIGERVIYPFLPSQGRGIEDARFCRFTDDDGGTCYRGTFTAFDGQQVRQSVFSTADFSHLSGRRLDGDLAYRKGAAWFPRKIGGRYAMLGRLDDESVSVLMSDDPDTWNGGVSVIQPRFPWELVQMGNCGSPIELPEGWLVLTHGVGRARRYCMGAALLDRDDPTKLLARLSQPLLEPSEDELGGYVPNVVYSCGAMLRDRTLLLPYGIADNFATLGTVEVDALLAAMS